MVDFYNRLDDRLYAGGTVQFFAEIKDGTEALRKQFVQLLTSFYKELEISTPLVDPQTITSYTLSHKMGLTVAQEYELLQISSEKERYEYLIQHLTTILPTIRSVNRTKEIIKMNGHFKNFNPLDFENL